MTKHPAEFPPELLAMQADGGLAEIVVLGQEIALTMEGQDVPAPATQINRRPDKNVS